MVVARADADRNNVVFFEHLFLGVRALLQINTSLVLWRLRLRICFHGNARNHIILCVLLSTCWRSAAGEDSESYICVLQVGDMETAHAFYEEGLGLVYDPSVRSGQKKGVGVSWLNIGDQQVVVRPVL